MERKLGTYGACAALSAMVTAGFSWSVTLLGWALGFLVAWLRDRLPKRKDASGAAGITWIACAFLLGAVLLGAENAFPAGSTYPFLSAALLLVLGRAMIGDAETPERTATVLGLLMLPVLGLTLILGGDQIRWVNNARPSGSPEQVALAALNAAPWWAEGVKSARDRRWYGLSAITAVAMSAFTWGTLGGRLASGARFPLYRAVQTVRLLGTLHRIEALTACAILLGALCLLLLLGQRAKAYLGPGKEKTAAFLAAAFLIEWGIRMAREMWGAAADTAFWGLTAIMTLWVVLPRKIVKK